MMGIGEFKMMKHETNLKLKPQTDPGGLFINRGRVHMHPSLKLMSVPAYIKSENHRHYRYDEQNKGSYHFLTPFKVTSPPIKNRRAQLRPSISTRGLLGERVSTYIATISFEISRRYLPKFVVCLSLNSIIKEYRALQYLSRRNRGCLLAKKAPGHFWISVYENGVCGANGIYQFPKQPIKYLHRIEAPIVRLKPFYSSSLSFCGQLIKPTTNENTITEAIIHLKPGSNSPKNPLIQAATTVSLNISKNALEIRSLLCLLNISIVREYLAPQYLSRVKKVPNPFWKK
ncbi:MAG: hypothetical protein KAR31_12170 [Candidatus Omnitrophica bacterium]|nr:hypothetical protein [Candidatus Omnitrophota bacterium]